LAYLQRFVVGAHREPTESAATEMRPPSRIVRNCLSPWPRAPSRFSSGTAASTNDSSRVSDARQPILRYFLERVKPGVSCGTMMFEISGGRGVVPGDRGDRRAAGDVGAAVGDEGLGPVDRPSAVAQLGARRVAAGVAAGAGLGQAEAPQHLAARERNEVLLLLLLGAEEKERRRAQRDVRRQRDRVDASARAISITASA
jgi:hypothetical protein